MPAHPPGDQVLHWYELPDALFEMDLKTGLVRYLNAAAEEMSGFTQEDVEAGVHWGKLTTSESVATMAKALRLWFGENVEFNNGPAPAAVPAQFEITGFHKDGTEYPLEGQGSVVVDDDGKPLAARLVMRDVTERNRTRDWLEAQAKLLERITFGDELTSVLEELCLLVESLGDEIFCAVYLSDPEEGRLTFLAGPTIPKTKSRGLNGFRMKYGPDRKPHHMSVKDFARVPGLERSSATGRRWGIVDTWSMPILGAGGAVLGTFGVYSRKHYDPTDEAMQRYDQAAHLAGVAMQRHEAAAENVRLESELRESQKLEAIGRLVSGIAHDFNNALAVTMGHTSFLLAAKDEGDPDRVDLVAIRESTDRSAELVRQLLAFGKKQELQPQLLDLGGLVGEFAAMVRRIIGEDIELTVDIEEGTRPVLADPGQLQQVLMNLVVNARDAMPGGGALRISVTSEDSGGSGGGMVVVRVADTGMGIEGAVLEKIFEPYFTTKPAGTSSGLGLSMAHGIISQSGGQIEVESKLGEGTTFTVILPVAAAGAV